MTEEPFDVEIDTHKPWHMRRELFDGLTAKTKAEIAANWKESGMQLPTEAELKRLPLEQRGELMGVVQAVARMGRPQIMPPPPPARSAKSLSSSVTRTGV